MTLGGSWQVSPRSVLDQQEMIYVKIISDYNDQVLAGGIKPCLPERFSEVSGLINDQVRTLPTTTN